MDETDVTSATSATAAGARTAPAELGLSVPGVEGEPGPFPREEEEEEEDDEPPPTQQEDQEEEDATLGETTTVSPTLGEDDASTRTAEPGPARPASHRARAAALSLALKKRGAITSPEVAEAFARVDRSAFLPKSSEHCAWDDAPLRAWDDDAQCVVHLSAPSIYATALEALELTRRSDKTATFKGSDDDDADGEQDGALSFLNVGSGAGYLSALAATLLGRHAVHHCVEISAPLAARCKALFETIAAKKTVVTHSKRRTSAARDQRRRGTHGKQGTSSNWGDADLEESPSSEDSFGAVPEIAHARVHVASCFELDVDSSMRFDRIYVGAGARASDARLLSRLLKPGGIIVGPFERDGLRPSRAFAFGAQSLLKATRRDDRDSIFEGPPRGSSSSSSTSSSRGSSSSHDRRASNTETANDDLGGETCLFHVDELMAVQFAPLNRRVYSSDGRLVDLPGGRWGVEHRERFHPAAARPRPARRRDDDDDAEPPRTGTGTAAERARRDEDGVPAGDDPGRGNTTHPVAAPPPLTRTTRRGHRDDDDREDDDQEDGQDPTQRSAPRLRSFVLRGPVWGVDAPDLFSPCFVRAVDLLRKLASSHDLEHPAARVPWHVWEDDVLPLLAHDDVLSEARRAELDRRRQAEDRASSRGRDKKAKKHAARREPRGCDVGCGGGSSSRGGSALKAQSVDAPSDDDDDAADDDDDDDLARDDGDDLAGRGRHAGPVGAARRSLAIARAVARWTFSRLA